MNIIKRFQKAKRNILLIITAIIQILVFIGLIQWFSHYFAVFYGFNILVSLVAVISILNNKSKPAYKMAWIIPIMLFPIFGVLFYLSFGGNKTGRQVRNKMQSIMQQTAEALGLADGCLESIQKQDADAGNQSRYLQEYSYYPPYKNMVTEYHAGGEEKFARLKEELKKAEHFIFLEYFIIEEGYMWNSILEILKEKAAKGVDVRVIYDDIGCLKTLPYRYDKKLEGMGIKCCIFHPVTLLLSARINNRDHRKIAVIDGHTGFVGGINLADEYINEVDKYGHWKDASLMIKGEAVWSLTVMFLSMWDYIKGIEEDLESYHAHSKSGKENDNGANSRDGFVQPFGDSPLDDEPVGEAVYLNLISKAKKYVYITTPYLIIDDGILNALCLAAKGGVDVRIITPYHADKWYVHAVSRSYYHTLVASGVRIYEYIPGFIHSKTFAVDDEYGVVGTINMDYRSLYLHFECGVWMYRCKCILDIRRDFENIMKVCTEVTTEKLKKMPWPKSLLISVLRVFAPLM